MPIHLRNRQTSSFETVIVPTGTNPVADSPTDSISYTSIDGSINIVGTDNPESVDFAVNQLAPPNFVLTVDCDASVIVSDWVRMNSSSIAVKAIADSLSNSNVLGPVESKPTSTTCVVRLTGATTEIFSGLDLTKDYFLSAVTAGAMVTVPPTSSGDVVLKLGQPISDKKLVYIKSTRMLVT